MQRSRRTNPYPFTWEIPAAVGVAVIMLLLLGLQAGRTVANAVVGNGWRVIDRAHLFSTLGGIFTGHADSGLLGVADPAGVALLWTCIGGVELVVLIGCGITVKGGLDRWGPGRVRGMATHSEAEALLGLTRLRKHATLIRPDLYGPGRGGGAR